MGWGTLQEVRDGSGDPLKGPGRVEGPFRKSGTGRETHPKVRDVSRDPLRGPRRV